MNLTRLTTVLMGATLATSALDRPAFGATVIEPDTGVEVRRITESQPAEAIQPVFAATQTFNADGSLLLLYRTGGGRVGHVVIDAVTGVEVNQLDLADSSDIENIAWDAIEPERLRYQRANEVVTVDVRSGSEESMAIDACERVDNGRSNRSTTSGTALLGLVCHRSDGSTSWIVVDTSTDQVVAERPSEIAEPPVALVSGNGFVVVDVDRVIHLDPELQTLGEIPIEASSWAVATDSDGSDLLVATVFGGPTEVGSVVVVDLATAEVRTIVGPETGYPYPPSGTQLSTAATGQPQLVAITTNDSAGGVLANEVMLLRLDGDGSSLIRLAHHRSSGTDVGDWPGHSMVAISPDGSTVLFSSDWGTDAIDTYAIDLTGMVDLGS